MKRTFKNVKAQFNFQFIHSYSHSIYTHTKKHDYIFAYNFILLLVCLFIYLFIQLNFSFISVHIYRANIASHASSFAQQQHGISMSTNQVEIVDQMQLKVNELCMKIDELEHELNIKAGTVDRKLKLNTFWINFVERVCDAIKILTRSS